MAALEITRTFGYETTCRVMAEDERQAIALTLMVGAGSGTMFMHFDFFFWGSLGTMCSYPASSYKNMQRVTSHLLDLVSFDY